ncbi:hypothetical protein COV82_03535, partial [Candidatus Peregrinibacteria bacterium CG11_big_fil_rev_8_21_14_0_20_46_8]
HGVAVLTAAPNYPDGEIYKGYKNRFHKEEMDGVTIARVPVILSKKKGVTGRLASYLSFVMNGMRQAKKMPAPDILWATSPPLFTALIGLKAKKMWKVPLVMDIRDIWPASIRDVQAVHNKHLLNIAERLAEKTYAAADAITTTSDGILQSLPTQHHVKAHVIPNGVDEKLFSEEAQKKALSQNPLPQRLHHKFVVLYAGNLGLAQAPEVMIEAASLLHHGTKQIKKRDDIHFVIVGSGVRTESMRELAQQKQLTNITFTGIQPHEKIPAYIAHSNLCLIPYKAEETFRRTLASKVFDYMAGGKPIIINLEGETAAIIKEAQCGFVAKDEDPRDLVKYITYFADDPEVAAQMGHAGREYAMQHFRRETIAKKLEEVIMNLHATVP